MTVVILFILFNRGAYYCNRALGSVILEMGLLPNWERSLEGDKKTLKWERVLEIVGLLEEGRAYWKEGV